MKKNGTAPAGMINKECETIVAVGAIISEIPCVDKIDISKIKTGDKINIENDTVKIYLDFYFISKFSYSIQ